MKKIALLFSAAAACFLVSGLFAAEGEKAAAESGPAEKTVKPILIRHGFVYSAEISKLKPNFQMEVKGDQPPFPEPAWAAVMLKLPKNRGISRFDYELKTPSGTYPCLAVALGSEPFSQKRDRWTIEAKKEQEGKFVRILFAFPVADMSQDPLQDLELVFKMRDSVCQPPPIPFRVLPDDQPLSANPQILGENGNCGLSWLELHPELLPSLDDNPTEEKEGKKEDGKEEAKADVKAEKKPAAEEKASEKPADKTEKKAAAEEKAPAKEKAEKKPAAAEEKASAKEKAEKKPAAAEEKASAKEKAEKKPAAADEKASAKEKAEKKPAAGKEEEKPEKSAGKTGKKAVRGKTSKK